MFEETIFGDTTVDNKVLKFPKRLPLLVWDVLAGTEESPSFHIPFLELAEKNDEMEFLYCFYL